uniref:ATP synthase F0 subunit 8 n=1 Tax=Lasioglossum sp. SJW-2017 TaxID=2008742 RepID=A0A343DRG9_9HYME|nr:ATP synthase F0 subunit 8 [Lasioglossum sp. SJW-2017]
MIYSFIPQMSPMYWTLLLIYTIMIMIMYMSLLYFSPMMLNYSYKLPKKYTKLTKKLIF